jgi:hypothetical protein
MQLALGTLMVLLSLKKFASVLVAKLIDKAT